MVAGVYLLARPLGPHGRAQLRADLARDHRPADRPHRAGVGRRGRARAARAGGGAARAGAPTGAAARRLRARRGRALRPRAAVPARPRARGSGSRIAGRPVEGRPHHPDAHGAAASRSASRPTSCTSPPPASATRCKGMILDPVFYLRGGRRLPVPPPWDHLDGFLQRAGDLQQLNWPIPSLSTSQQLFVWFFFLLGTVAFLVFVAVRVLRADPVVVLRARAARGRRCSASACCPRRCSGSTPPTSRG